MSDSNPTMRAINAALLVATVITSAFGVFQLAEYVFKATTSLATSVLVGSILTGLILVPFAFLLTTPKVLSAFGVARLKSRRICLRYEKQIEISKDFRAHVRAKQSWVFLDAPDPDDLVDLYSVAADQSIENFQYDSKDAIERGRKQIARHKLVVFWRPKKPIYPFTEYVHQDEYDLPFSYDAPACYTEFISTFETGQFRCVIHTPMRTEKVVLFVRPRFRMLRTDRAFMSHVLRTKEFKWGKSEVVGDGRTIVWELTNPPAGHSYLCVYFREGGVEYWRKQTSIRELVARLLRRIRPGSPTVPAIPQPTATPNSAVERDAPQAARPSP